MGRFLFFLATFLTAYANAENIPLSCTQVPLQEWFHMAEHNHSFLASCATADGEPVRGDGAMPDTSEFYSSEVLDSLQVVTSCLGLSIKEIMPLFKGESGFVINAVGRAFDSGIGQLTDSAIEDVNDALPAYHNYIVQNSATNSSCLRLANAWDLLTKNHSSAKEHRCEFLTTPLNPLKNILWAGILVQRTQHQVMADFVAAKIDTALSNMQFPMDRLADLVHILSYMSYNQGAGATTNLLGGYLNGLWNELIREVTIDRFDFTQDLSWLDKIDKNLWKSIPIKNLTFPAFVKIYSTQGNPHYLGSLYEEVVDYEQKVGPSICTPESLVGFLKL